MMRDFIITLAGVVLGFFIAKLTPWNLRKNDIYTMEPDDLLPVLSDALRRFDEWKLDQFTATHKSGLVLWISNGIEYFRTYDTYSRFRFVMTSDRRKKLWPLIEALKEYHNNTENTLEESLNLIKALAPQKEGSDAKNNPEALQGMPGSAAEAR